MEAELESINGKILEDLYSDFVSFIKVKTGEDFSSFKKSKYFTDEENYKFEINKNAKEILDFPHWRPEIIGKEIIQKKIIAAIKVKVPDSSGTVINNLIWWSKQDDFSKQPISYESERMFYNFFKGKISDKDSFEKFREIRLSYQFIAYLYFIKDMNKYMPISQEKFDKVFKRLGIPDFKTRNNVSWENYMHYCDIIKQVYKFLKIKDKEIKLLEAHSFLWILGDQMNSYFQEKNQPISVSAKEKANVFDEELSDKKINKSTTVSDDLFIVGKEAEYLYPDEIAEERNQDLYEGAIKLVYVNAYERNQIARTQCIHHWKAICAICGLDFEKYYGEIGKGFIHVHHLNLVSKQGNKPYIIDPINDLIPVCPNCHSMLHRKVPPYTIDELKELLKNYNGIT